MVRSRSRPARRGSASASGVAPRPVADEGVMSGRATRTIGGTAGWATRSIGHRLSWGVLALALVGCSKPPAPCLAPKDCQDGYECLASRCLPRHADPILGTSARIVRHPVRIATESGDVSEDAVTVGGARGGTTLYLAFAPLADEPTVSTAFLALEPATLSGPSAARGTLTVTPLLDPWDSGPPRRSTRSVEGLVHGGRPVLVDVTPLYQGGWPTAFAIESSIEHGWVMSLGSTDATGPRLELYLSRKATQ